MHIERVGHGPRYFLGLHGWSGDHRTFLPLTANLPDEVSFFSADLPGCGQSREPHHWTLESVAAEIAEVIRALPKPLTVVGQCSGALLAIAAARHADGIDRLVLIDLFATFPWYFRVFLSPLIGRYAYATTFRNPLGRLLTNVSLRGKRTGQTTLTGGFAQVNHDVTYRYLQLLEDYPAPETFAALAPAVDILYGEKTFQAVRDSVSLWQAVWPRATATCLRGAGHLPILEATDQVRAILYGGASDRSKCQVVSTAIEN